MSKPRNMTPVQQKVWQKLPNHLHVFSSVKDFSTFLEKIYVDKIEGRLPPGLEFWDAPLWKQLNQGNFGNDIIVTFAKCQRTVGHKGIHRYFKIDRKLRSWDPDSKRYYNHYDFTIGEIEAFFYGELDIHKNLHNTKIGRNLGII